jgi:hypothetical protein
MRIVKNRHVVPPGGWRLPLVLAGEYFPDGKTKEQDRRAATKEALVAKARAFREANGLPIPPDFSAVIEDLVCSQMPPGTCRGAQGPIPEGVVIPGLMAKLTIKDVYHGGRVFAPWVRAGKPLVETSVAAERGRICAGCPYNVPFEPCGSCSRLYRAVRRLRPKGSSTPSDSKLKVCAICKCDNRTAAHIPLEFIFKGIPEVLNEQLPAHCWKKREETTT